MPKLEISARMLYGYLEPPQTFAGWIREATENYGYCIGDDWNAAIYESGPPDWMRGKGDVLLSIRFAEKLIDIEERRKEQSQKRHPVVEYRYPYPGEIPES